MGLQVVTNDYSSASGLPSLSPCPDCKLLDLFVGDGLDPELVGLLHRNLVLVKDRLFLLGDGDDGRILALEVAEDGEDGILVDLGLVADVIIYY